MSTAAINTAARISKRANLEDEVTRQAFDVFDLITAAGQRRSIQIERSRACDARAVHRAMLDANAALPASTSEALAQVERAISQPAPRQMRYAAHLGWRSDNRGFVFSDGCIGETGQHSDILAPSCLLTRRIRIHVRHGSLNQWKRQVAAPAANSTAMVLALAAAFAAPLCPPAGAHSKSASKICTPKHR